LALLVPAPSFAYRDGACRDGAAAGQTRVNVGYSSTRALRAAVSREGGRVVRTVPALRVAQVTADSRSAERLARRPGIRFVERAAKRRDAAEPALALAAGKTVPWEWQYAAVREDAVPEWVIRAAGSVTIAVIDTGADLTAPDIAAKAPVVFNARTGATDVRDTLGHGTFVASLAAGSVTNGDGIAGFGGDAELMVIKAGPGDGSFTDVDEATAITYAVDHGARVINLSLGGAGSSATEQEAVDYAASRGVLLVAAAGNQYTAGNPVMYPAALLQPLGSNGVDGTGLSVAASDAGGERAAFSNTGSYVSLAAPGDNVFSAVSSASSWSLFPRVTLPGSGGGYYGYGSGTSFAAPQVSGAASLVMAANPFLDAAAVARVLKESASGHGVWTPQLGYGVIDVAAAVALAAGTTAPAARATLTLKAKAAGRTVRLSARLASIVPAVVTSSRRVVFELAAGPAWKRVGNSKTTATGDAAFTLRNAKPGRLKLRARWAGTAQLAPALSRAVAVTLRP
jgi:subtilisin family serine protease